jgi:hypothetical protein
MRADSIEVVVRRIVHDVAIPDVNLHTMGSLAPLVQVSWRLVGAFVCRLLFDIRAVRGRRWSLYTTRSHIAVSES